VFRDTVKYVEDGKYPHARRHFLPVLCNHCEDAPCLTACPTGAISRPDGQAVIIDKSLCNANRMCMTACPYGAIYIDPFESVAQKCTFCEHRTAQGLMPACVDACPTRCRIFGDLDDRDSEIAQKAASNRTAVWKPAAGTRPRVLYIDPKGALDLIKDAGIQAGTEDPAQGPSERKA
jgi:Fe-S-cluster-containing dehydrogenase component